MSHYRPQVTRTDASQPAIVDALRKAGFDVWIIGRPCDLLLRRSTDPLGVFRCLEVKSPTKSGTRRRRNDQKAQEEFCRTTGTPYVTTPQEALEAVGANVGYIGRL